MFVENISYTESGTGSVVTFSESEGSLMEKTDSLLFDLSSSVLLISSHVFSCAPHLPRRFRTHNRSLVGQ